jgi:wyosine [tRNA(Phe)-imidazoG37] synthetase (radical SAM superfamily)
VISNGSLLWQESVRNDLSKADWVSLKIDSVTEEYWRQTNRPHHDLDLSIILEAMVEFAGGYEGQLATETMLIHGVNDSPGNITKVADFLARLKPAKAYLSIPTRPPAETSVHPPAENVLNMAYQIISKRVNEVECLFGYEGNAFSLTGDAEEELLNIIAVHPMPEEAVQAFLAKAGVGWKLIDKLIAKDRLFVTDYEGKKFYLRSLQKTGV